MFVELNLIKPYIIYFYLTVFKFFVIQTAIRYIIIESDIVLFPHTLFIKYKQLGYGKKRINKEKIICSLENECFLPHLLFLH